MVSSPANSTFCRPPFKGPILRLSPVAGPPLDSIELTRSGGVIGRGSTCEVRLVDPTVSRRHASISCQDDHWLIQDLGGANGTLLNEVKIEDEVASILAEGDRIRVGPWSLQVGTVETTSMAMRTLDDAGAEDRVRRVSPAETASLARHRLNLFIECAGRINQAYEETTLWDSILLSALEGSGFGRGALLRSDAQAESVEIIAYRGLDGGDGRPDDLSRSLIRAAAEGDMAQMLSDEQPAYGQSIADLNIHSALCCPIMVDDIVAASLYLDARGTEATVQNDAASFCQALVRIAGLAIANLRRRELVERQQRMESDLSAAREAQHFMLPPSRGVVGSLPYAMQFQPGRYASGDLFDVIPLPDGRVGFGVGDVSGKGIGAAILMAAAQSHIHSVLMREGDPTAAATAVNEYVLAHSAVNRFISLWLGVLDPVSLELIYVDAGHGHWALCDAEGNAASERIAAHPPIGIDSDTSFEANQLQCKPGTRIVVMTDGVVEQPREDQEQFGMDRALAVLEKCTSPAEDVESLHAAVCEFAKTDQLADDTTIASIQLPMA
ncbi:MAG: SpoIIE family protein phosphatase [Phycisphaerales bacterium]|nr:SpoIIE family protein phosphatase [Phycisphaerales bacterium]